jgi:hypothetical protein
MDHKRRPLRRRGEAALMPFAKTGISIFVLKSSQPFFES